MCGNAVNLRFDLIPVKVIVVVSIENSAWDLVNDLARGSITDPILSSVMDPISSSVRDSMQDISDE